MSIRRRPTPTDTPPARRAARACAQARRPSPDVAASASASRSRTTPSRRSTDPVTEFDRAAEALIVGELRRAPTRRRDRRRGGRRHHGHHRARMAPRPDRRHRQLRLRPADVVHVGRRASTTSGAVAGAVYVPVLDEMFSAARGAGATLNGEPIAASERDVARDGARRHRVQLPPASDGGPRRRAWPRCSPRSATSGGSDRRRSTSASSPAAGSTPTSSSTSTAGTSPPGVLIAAEAGATSLATSTAAPPSTDGVVVAAPAIHAGACSALIAAHRLAERPMSSLGSDRASRVASIAGGSGIMGAWVHASWPSKTTSASVRR